MKLSLLFASTYCVGADQADEERRVRRGERDMRQPGQQGDGIQQPQRPRRRASHATGIVRTTTARMRSADHQDGPLAGTVVDPAADEHRSQVGQPDHRGEEADLSGRCIQGQDRDQWQRQLGDAITELGDRLGRPQFAERRVAPQRGVLLRWSRSFVGCLGHREAQETYAAQLARRASSSGCAGRRSREARRSARSISVSSSRVTSSRVLAMPDWFRHSGFELRLDLGEPAPGQLDVVGHHLPGQHPVRGVPLGIVGVFRSLEAEPASPSPATAAAGHRSTHRASSTSPKPARWRRCQLVTDGVAPTSGDNWVAVAGPWRCSRVKIASLVGWASARIAFGSVISKSPIGFVRDIFRE